MKITTPDNLTFAQRFQYRMAYGESPAHLTHAEKHMTAMDALMAHSLATPGLDGFVMKLANDDTKNWDASGRNREFARGLEKGVTLKTAWQNNTVRSDGNGGMFKDEVYAYAPVPEFKK